MVDRNSYYHVPSARRSNREQRKLYKLGRSRRPGRNTWEVTLQDGTDADGNPVLIELEMAWSELAAYLAGKRADMSSMAGRRGR